MITAVSAAVALLLASGVQSQTPPPAAPRTTPQAAPRTPAPASTDDLTSSLNSGPPRPATYLAPEPATTLTPPRGATPEMAEPAELAPARPATARPAPTRPAPTSPAPSSPAARPTPAPSTTPPVRTAPATTPPARVPAPSVAAPRPTPTAPANPASPPRTAPATAPAPGTAPATAPARPTPAPTRPAAEPAPVSPPAGVTALDAAARADLPFTVELPAGFEIVTGRPGPDFRIYTIRRGDRSFAMIYAGPASQFPIYSGEMVEAGGRASVVMTDGGQRRALEHLFQRPDAPREIHVWTMSLEGADRAVAEQIAQSVDVP